MAKSKAAPLRVNTTRFGANSGMCFEELGAYLTCVAVRGVGGWTESNDQPLFACRGARFAERMRVFSYLATPVCVLLPSAS